MGVGWLAGEKILGELGDHFSMCKRVQQILREYSGTSLSPTYLSTTSEFFCWLFNSVPH